MRPGRSAFPLPRIVTLLDLFAVLYQLPGTALNLPGIRVHPRADAFCRSWRAAAVTTGQDIYLSTGSFAPGTAAGLRVLAHEVAHVVQQHRGPVTTSVVTSPTAIPLTGTGPAACSRWRLGPAGAAEEAEAEAAADAVLAGQPFRFGPPAPGAIPVVPGQLAVQRYTAWEHLLLSHLDPPVLAEVTGRGAAAAAPGPIEEQCALLADLGRNPDGADPARIGRDYPGVRAARLSASGMTVTLGEISILADYLSHPDDIDAAPERFVVPVVQAVRAQSYRELHRVMGRRPPSRPAWSPLRFPVARAFAGIREAVEVDALGRKCQLPAWERYLSVLGRNAAHFAPFSWYRWQSFHLAARRMIEESAAAPESGRDRVRSRALVYAGYADHFLHDSFAAGHLVNKTLIMQWYVEWLTRSRWFLPDRDLLAGLTCQLQPELHGPGLYRPVLGGDGERWYPGGLAVADPQSALETGSMAARMQASGISGADADRQQRYLCYLALLGSSVAQMSASVVHDYLNQRSLIVASSPADSRYQLWGDRTLLAAPAGTLRAAVAAHTSRRAIGELLDQGHTGVASREIFQAVPTLVEVGGELLPLPDWHQAELRELCFGKLFRLGGTRARKLALSVLSREFGVPSADYAELRRLSTSRPGTARKTWR